jgi:hypothetical protein
MDCSAFSLRGGGLEKKGMKVTCMYRGAKKKALTRSIFFYRVFFIAFFGRFVTRGFKNTIKVFPKESIWQHLGSSQPMWLFFPPFFFPPSVVFIEVLVPRRWSQNDAQQNQAKKTPSHMKTTNRLLHLFFFKAPLAIDQQACGFAPSASSCKSSAHLSGRTHLRGSGTGSRQGSHHGPTKGAV